MEETAMVTDLREICEQFSDDHIKVKIDICATNFPNKIKVEIYATNSQTTTLRY